MEAQTRYTIDRVGPLEWQIIDSKLGRSPSVYLLYAAPVAHKSLNCQIVLTYFDAVETLNDSHRTFSKELWSSILYVDSLSQLVSLVEDIYDTLADVEIEEPYELAYVFGGTVGSEHVVCPPMLITN